MLRRGTSYKLSISIGLALLVSLVAFSALAHSQDPEAALSEAELSMSSAEGAIGEAEAQLKPAEDRYKAATRKALPAKQQARAARSEVTQLRTDARERQLDARSQIARIESDHAKAVDDYNQEVETGIAVGLVALIVAALALSWAWFRASAAVAWLTDLPQGQAIGLCVGTGLSLVIAGAALAEIGGVMGVLGMLIFLLGLVLPVAFLLARHSAQIQRGRARPLLKRDRMPRWVNRALAATMAVIFFAGMGSAIFATGPAPEEISAALLEEAGGEQTEEEVEKLAAAEGEATDLRRQASKLSADQTAARAALRDVRSQLSRAELEMARAQNDVQYYTKRLAALSARETRAAEERAEIEAEELEEESFESESSGCDPNYTGCVPNTGYDVDCAEVGGSVEVIGVDVDGLDADNDGIGCE